MNAFQHRAILVKNDDTSITYVGNWTTVQTSAVNNLGNFGPPFSSILHSTTTISSFTFLFHGFSINVLGTINIANSSTNPNPTWQCFLDGINLGSPNIGQAPENHWPLCSEENFLDGAHELVVNVTSNGMPFYLDYIAYQPSSSVSLENSLINIENEDHSIDYISGWSASGVANQTTDPEGLVNIPFVGIQLSWYGLISTHNASSGEYSIDGQPYSSFQLPSLPQSSTITIFNQLFFMTPTLEMGAHTLSAKYTGGPGQTPLTLDYLVVTNGSFPSTNSSPHNHSGGAQSGNSTPSPAPPINNINSKSSSHTVGSIVGGAVGGIGGVAVVICSIIIFLWLRSRKRRSRTRENVRSVIESSSVQSQFVSPAPLLALNQTAGSQGTSYIYPSQLTTSLCSNLVSSSNNPVSLRLSPYATDETSSRSRRRLPAPAPPTQYIPSAPVGRTPTITPIQHEDSGIRLPQPVLDEIVVEIPPAYSEL